MLKHKVLLVEDEPNYASVVKRMIEYDNFEVMHSLNGRDALQVVEENMPQIVICDVCMPIMNGYQFFKAFKELPSAANVPFLFLTSLSTQEELRRGMSLGADEYLPKSVSRSDLLEAIYKQLNRKKEIENEVDLLIDKHFSELIVKSRGVDDFRDNLSHQIGAPLHSLVELINQLDHAHLDDKNKKLLTMVKTLVSKIDLVIDVSNRTLNN